MQKIGFNVLLMWYFQVTQMDVIANSGLQMNFALLVSILTVIMCTPFMLMDATVFILQHLNHQKKLLKKVLYGRAGRGSPADYEAAFMHLK